MPAHSVINGPVDHDGARYENGETIPRLSIEEAAALILAKVVGATPVVAKASNNKERDD